MYCASGGSQGVTETSVLPTFIMWMEIPWDGLLYTQKWQAIVIQAWEGRGLVQLIQEPESVSQRYKIM